MDERKAKDTSCEGEQPSLLRKLMRALKLNKTTSKGCLTPVKQPPEPQPGKDQVEYPIDRILADMKTKDYTVIPLGQVNMYPLQGDEATIHLSKAFLHAIGNLPVAKCNCIACRLRAAAPWN